MQSITINTTQNVYLEHNLASVGERMVATILDNVFMFVYIIAVLALISTLEAYSTATMVIIFTPIVIYHFVMEIVFGGQSLGKKIMKIKVVKIDGSQAGFASYFIRWIFRIVDITLFYGVVAIITISANGRGQRLGDLAARTTVIRLTTRHSVRSFLFMELPEGYTQHFEGVHLLSEDNMKTVAEVLRKQANFNTETTRVLLYETKYAVEKKLNIKSDMEPAEFLKTILKDYIYYNRNESETSRI